MDEDFGEGERHNYTMAKMRGCAMRPHFVAINCGYPLCQQPLRLGADKYGEGANDSVRSCVMCATA
jgi:hypothetical protein